MSYRAPVADMLFTMRHVAGLDQGIASGLYADLADGVTEAVLEEAGKFASDVLAPLNRVGDEHGITLEAGKVTTAPGWPDAYKRWTAAGWNAVSGSEAFGGQGLPLAINAACTASISAGCARLMKVSPSSSWRVRPSKVRLAGLAKRTRPSAPWRVIRSIALSARKR